jgi:glycosyltransferase A (GT-A) superfamily protein (DUF2064 family)
MVVLMGRWPVLGEGKSRLAAEVGVNKAHQVHQALFANALRVFAENPNGCVLAVTGERPEVVARALNPIPVIAQRGENLGDRMLNALCDAADLTDWRGPSAVVGTDLPALTLRHVLHAEAAIAGGVDAAVVPAVDGGFGLMMMRDWPADLWPSGMKWGTDRVLLQTKQQLQAKGLSWWADSPVADIDEWSDWVDFCEKHPNFARYGSI